MGAITPGAFALDGPPLDSPFYALDAVGDPAVASGQAIFVELQAYRTVSSVGLIAHAESYGPANSGGTAAIDTTGANLLVVAFNGGSIFATFSDNLGNVWTQLGGAQGSTAAQRLYYVNSHMPNVGPGHTISWTGANAFACIQFLAFRSNRGWALNTVTGANVTLPATGPALTTISANELVISAASAGSAVNIGVTAVSDGLQIVAFHETVGGVNYGTAWAYKIHPTIGAVTGTWTGIATAPLGIHIVSFTGEWVSPVETLYFATEGYNDPSAPSYFAPRMQQSLNFRRDLFSGNTTGGPNRVSFGEMRLANGDGGLDMLRTQYAFAGWPARLLIGDPSQAYGTFEAVIIGKPQQVFYSTNDIAVTLRDRLQDFSTPIQTNKYLGDNVLPLGVEGNIDLKDKLKPLLFGRVQNISPIQVNTSKLIYQINDGPIEQLFNVKDQGADLTRGGDYVDINDMMTNQPISGQFRTLMSAGYFRLGALPVGTITCDCADKWAYDGAEKDIGNTAAQVATRIAIRPIDSGEGGVTSADVNWADVTELDRIQKAPVGIWLADDTDFSGALDRILGSVGAWYGFDRLGMFRLQRHSVPLGNGVCTFKIFGPDVDATIGEFDIIDVRFLPTNDPDKGVPTWEMKLDYGLNYTVQSKDDLAGIVTEETKEFLRLQFRTAVSTNSSVKDAYPLAISKKFTTLLLNQVDAEAEATRLLQMYNVQRDFIEIDTPMTSELVASIDIGSEVFLQLQRFNYQAGRPMKIIGMTYNPSGRGLTLSLWG